MKFNLSDKERTYRGSKVIDSFNVKEFIKIVERIMMDDRLNLQAKLVSIRHAAGDKLT